jgi:hypothetical protein
MNNKKKTQSPERKVKTVARCDFASCLENRHPASVPYTLMPSSFMAVYMINLINIPNAFKKLCIPPFF